MNKYNSLLNSSQLNTIQQLHTSFHIMPQTVSLNSLEQHLPRASSSQMIYSKQQYFTNLKSQCIYKQNALKTAQNLIQEYQRQNEQLKKQIKKLNNKVQIYQEQIQIFQTQLRDNYQEISNKHNKHVNNIHYQKQLFKTSNKLSHILQKYSQLQQKYHKLENQLIKYKNYKKQLQKKLDLANRTHQKQLKIQVQKHFDNFLSTPINRQFQSETQSSSKKNKQLNKSSKTHELNKTTKTHELNTSINKYELNKSSKKHELLELLQKKTYPTQKQQQKLGQNVQDKKQKQQKSPIKQYFSRSQSIKQQNKRQKPLIFQRQTQIFQRQTQIQTKLKILQWKLNQKDEEIMLMLRRNKQIQDKYKILIQIYQRNVSKNNTNNKEYQLNNKFTSDTNEIYHPLQTYNALQKYHLKQIHPKVNHFNASINQSTDHSWKQVYGSFYS